MIERFASFTEALENVNADTPRLPPLMTLDDVPVPWIVSSPLPVFSTSRPPALAGRICTLSMKTV